MSLGFFSILSNRSLGDNNLVLGFQNFGYEFFAVGGRCLKATLQTLRWKISVHVDGGPSRGLVCADPGARTPIGMSRNLCKTTYGIIILAHLSKCEQALRAPC
jgi:hypothetical protein